MYASEFIVVGQPGLTMVRHSAESLFNIQTAKPIVTINSAMAFSLEYLVLAEDKIPIKL